jgi:hypothetical protein
VKEQISNLLVQKFSSNKKRNEEAYKATIDTNLLTSDVKQADNSGTEKKKSPTSVLVDSSRHVETSCSSDAEDDVKTDSSDGLGEISSYVSDADYDDDDNNSS